MAQRDIPPSSLPRIPQPQEEIEDDAASFSPAVFDQPERLQVPRRPHFPSLLGYRDSSYSDSTPFHQRRAFSALMRPPFRIWELTECAVILSSTP